MKRKVSPIAKAILENNNVENMADIQGLMKNLYKDMISILLESEMEETLGYSKHERSNNENARNGYTPKKVKTSLGEIDIDIPRDREGEYTPVAIPKYSRDISDLEDKIISMYSRGMSTSDINEHMEEIYGMSFSPSQISRITDNILEELETWRKRPLKPCYPFVFLDAMYFNVKHNGKVVKKAAQVVIGVDLEGKKDILNISIEEGETSKSWLKVLNDLKMRGLDKILIISIDGHKSFGSAIEAIYPEAKIQRCIVHQLRYTLKFLNYKERKVFSKELKEVYTSNTAEEGYSKLKELDKKYIEYKAPLKSWFDNWNELSTFFDYPQEIRKIMYTTNMIESLNSQFKKVSGSKGVYPTDNSLLKILYLSSKNITKKWTQKIRGWEKILRIISIEFEEELKEYI